MEYPVIIEGGLMVVFDPTDAKQLELFNTVVVNSALKNNEAAMVAGMSLMRAGARLLDITNGHEYLLTDSGRQNLEGLKNKAIQ